MARTYATGHPGAYAAGKLPTMRSRWNGAPGASVRSMGDRAGWRGTPPEALMGVTANSDGPSDDTTATHVFHEIGLYQLPAGPVSAPANSQPSAPNNVYVRMASDARVRALIGGSPSLSAWQTDIPGQVATGLVSLADDRDALSRTLGGAGYRDAGSQWALALGVLAYVLGSSGVAHALGDAPAAVADVPENQRFGALVRRLVATRPGDRTWGYPVVRTWQRLATGAALARTTGGNAAWFDLGLGANRSAYEDAVSAAAYGGGSGVVVSMDGQSAASGVADLGALGALGVLAWKFSTGRWPWERR